MRGPCQRHRERVRQPSPAKQKRARIGPEQKRSPMWGSNPDGLEEELGQMKVA